MTATCYIRRSYDSITPPLRRLARAVPHGAARIDRVPAATVDRGTVNAGLRNAGSPSPMRGAPHGTQKSPSVNLRSGQAAPSARGAASGCVTSFAAILGARPSGPHPVVRRTLSRLGARLGPRRTRSAAVPTVVRSESGGARAARRAAHQWPRNWRPRNWRPRNRSCTRAELPSIGGSAELAATRMDGRTIDRGAAMFRAAPRGAHAGVLPCRPHAGPVRSD